MASDVDISNLALALLADSANVQSLSSPDSAQAVYCQRFYPMARDMLLEAHDWNFNSRRDQLELLGDATTQTGDWVAQWLYTYKAPTQMLRMRVVQDADAPSDTEITMPPTLLSLIGGFPSLAAPMGPVGYVPQSFVMETNAAGQLILRTNQANAMGRYTVRITDTTKFSPMFVTTLAHLLGAFLAGPIIKGAEGRQVAANMLQSANQFMMQASSSDSSQRRLDDVQSVAPWIACRS